MTHTPQRLSASVNGIRLSYLSVGEGPLVVFLHGFPELGDAWRHQLGPVAGAGYHAVAPDLRGYGESSAPLDPTVYSQFDLAGDVTGLMDVLGVESAVLVGHDMGATLAWTMATMVPRRVRSLAVLSVPHKPRGAAPPVTSSPPGFYQRLFQPVGPEDADLHEHARSFLWGIFDRLGGSSPLGPPPALIVPPGGNFRDLFDPPDQAPPWTTRAELDHTVAVFERTGFRGALNWYRNIDRNWHTAAAWAPGDVDVPAVFAVGTLDVTYALFGANGVIAGQGERVHDLRDVRIIDGAGHWLARERPDEVTDFLLDHLADLDGGARGVPARGISRPAPAGSPRGVG